jgi:hypothetical protein
LRSRYALNPGFAVLAVFHVGEFLAHQCVDQGAQLGHFPLQLQNNNIGLRLDQLALAPPLRAIIFERMPQRFTEPLQNAFEVGRSDRRHL